MKSLMNKKRNQNTLKKVSKTNNHHSSFTQTNIYFQKKQLNTIINNDIDIKQIALNLKNRLSIANRKISSNSIKSKNNINSNNSTSLKNINTTSLKNLKLLKQYLTFVSNEVDEIKLNQEKIQFTLSNSIEKINPVKKSYRLGATLIEALVHHHSLIMEKDQLDRTLNFQQKSRRPGRPPKQIIEEEKKKECIKCICDSPNEEFGSMVQCDDCLGWLHLDCLELNQEALEETFRCPCCFLSLGDKNTKLLSSITWRYAAQWKSQRLALVHNETDDENEDDDFMMDDTSSIETPETPSDWSDSSIHSTEIHTPNDHIYLNDPFDKFSSLKGNELVLDPESLEILSRIAYLQSLDTVRKEIFAPNASDVFLYENFNHDSNVPLMNLQTPRFAANGLPSDICSQDLSEYSFDSGPFWEPLY